ncbi:hypothetical protein [Pandoravirus japonicus]|uniref:Uncharacterized protein n=1 Tax=Pandoravirus japonicus TaxID=2823154 RepID=A0A811BQW9_9VIRU|nr:hypothetical protein [Pandoravirus japonicus]
MAAAAAASIAAAPADEGAPRRSRLRRLWWRLPLRSLWPSAPALFVCVVIPVLVVIPRFLGVSSLGVSLFFSLRETSLVGVVVAQARLPGVPFFLCASPAFCSGDDVAPTRAHTLLDATAAVSRARRQRHSPPFFQNLSFLHSADREAAGKKKEKRKKDSRLRATRRSTGPGDRASHPFSFPSPCNKKAMTTQLFSFSLGIFSGGPKPEPTGAHWSKIPG